MSEREMDVVSSLQKVARELREGTDVQAAAFLIDWIAQGLQRELDLAAQRAAQLQSEINAPWWGDRRSNRGYDLKQIGTGDEGGS